MSVQEISSESTSDKDTDCQKRKVGAGGLCTEG